MHEHLITDEQGDTVDAITGQQRGSKTIEPLSVSPNEPASDYERAKLAHHSDETARHKFWRGYFGLGEASYPDDPKAWQVNRP